ncbi:scopoletin glucosyltransferase [Brachypodium distachyon]|uniref:Glycosyltransferase n=1 Tax=Brachypodium distachyon TaxID=15368 RepID=I1HHY8_BRADI|nr:scopoletin glucosyltransferase [Brachypodium distachyon]KQK05555.1 hypothetical protein BRADI_2g20800v3 [Brachypodium distachyon]|eukprot:XP_003566074.1 scopoletin glucosyltransferase [Brachypodium distachyon]
MASAAPVQSKKLQILFIPFFATSHIGPHADFAVRLAAARPDAVEPTIAVTPANLPVARSALERHGPIGSSAVKIAAYPFPDVDGLPPGVENLSAAAGSGDAWRVDAAAIDEALTRPAQEALIRARSPDVVISDFHFFWNSTIAQELGVPCVTFSVVGSFSMLAMRHLSSGIVESSGSDGQDLEVTVPGFPGPGIRIPRTELPEFLRCQQKHDRSNPRLAASARVPSCFGLAVNTFLDLEQPYCEFFARQGYVRRAYFLGPLFLPLPQAGANTGESPPCIRWLGSMPSCSVLYVCFGTYASISRTQLQELALGLENSGKPFLWVLRADGWAPPEGWEARVKNKGMLVREWAPQTAILSHPAVGAFLTHCGWSSTLEAAAAGVPMLTWPLVFDQFIGERLVTDVLRIGERVWDGPRSTRYEEKETVPAEAVARAVAGFLEPGGTGEAARGRARELAVKARAAVVEGGSSYRDLRRLIDDLVEARAANGGAAATSYP